MAELLMGDEAVGLAAIHAGIGGAFSYPGTPATEILEFIHARSGPDGEIVAEWSANEKVAYEEALGMSYAGRRALVSMKHVGLNVAADPFMSSSLTGANGGLVLAVADDPGMHSSQNEQDSRYYAHFAQMPLLEPSNQQDAYDMTREAFELSERFGIPVMIRLVTRLAHSRSDIVTNAVQKPSPRPRVTDWREWTLLPVNARRRFSRLLDMQPALERYSEDSPFNRLVLRGPRGVIAAGLAHNYLTETIGDDGNWSVLKIGVYPPPVHLIRRLINHCDEVTILEEGYPFLERQLVGLLGVAGKSIRGKSSGALPSQGELNAEIVRAALGGTTSPVRSPSADIPGRPPQLCQGCPHCDTYRAILAACDGGSRPFLFGDIGCYTLAALEPYNAMDTCVDMGASIGMAAGAAKAGVHPVVATIGDSTFIHSGMTPLISAARQNLNMTVVILDNAVVAMTGGQDVFATGPDLLRIVRGLGVDDDHIVVLEPSPGTHETMANEIRREIEHPGLSVVVAQRACIHARRRAKDSQPAAAASPA